MKSFIILILALIFSTSAQAATIAPPDTTQQAQCLPTAADFGNLNYKTETPDCSDALGRERRRVIGNAAFIAVAVAVITALVWGAINQANANKS